MLMLIGYGSVEYMYSTYTQITLYKMEKYVYVVRGYYFLHGEKRIGQEESAVDQQIVRKYM